MSRWGLEGGGKARRGVLFVHNGKHTTYRHLLYFECRSYQISEYLLQQIVGTEDCPWFAVISLVWPSGLLEKFIENLDLLYRGVDAVRGMNEVEGSSFIFCSVGGRDRWWI
jgi:hypothetical protein